MNESVTARFWQFLRTPRTGACHRDSRVQETQREFLPAALEVQESPPSPLGRILLWLILLLFVLGIVWSALGTVDIVVTASGRIVPSGQVKIVQAIESGSVKTLHVKDGQRVALGQALVSLDSTYVDADARRIHEQLEDLTRQLKWRQALESWLAGGRKAVPELDSSAPSTNPDNMRVVILYQQKRTEISATLLALKKEIDANAAEQEALLADRDRVVATLGVLKERVSAYKALLENRYGARVEYLELLQQQTDLEQSVPVFQSRRKKLADIAASLVAQMTALEGEIRNGNLLELVRKWCTRRGRWRVFCERDALLMVL